LVEGRLEMALHLTAAFGATEQAQISTTNELFDAEPFHQLLIRLIQEPDETIQVHSHLPLGPRLNPARFIIT
jgi:hypothetical protein